MQLDTTIEQRKREINEISTNINQEREVNENQRSQLRDGQVDLLAKKLEKAKLVYAQEKNRTLAQRYDEVATSKFESSLTFV